MGDVIYMDTYRYTWKQVFSADGPASTIEVHVNEHNGEFEIVQHNDEGEAIRTCLSTVESVGLIEALKRAHEKLTSPKSPTSA